MEILDFNKILDRVIERYEVEVPKDRKQKARFRDRSKKKLVKIAKNYPSPGADSYFARAITRGGQTSPRFFTATDARDIIALAEDYFSKRSSNPHIRDLTKEYREKAAEMRAEIEERPSTEQLLAEHEQDQKNIAEAIRAAYDFDRGDMPFDEVEFDEFARKNAENIELDYYYQKGTESIEEDYSNYCEPVSASSEDIEKFIKDRKYGAIRKRDPFDENSPEIITEVYERPDVNPLPKAQEMMRELILPALFEVFYTPIDLDALKSDLFIASDPEDVHWDALYFMCKERLEDYSNYTAKKKTLEEMLEEHEKLISELSAKIDTLEERLFPADSKEGSTHSAYSITFNREDDSALTSEVERLRKAVSSTALIFNEINKSLRSLEDRVSKNEE